MSEYYDNPSKALEALEEIADEISDSGVSAKDVAAIIPIVQAAPEKLVSDLRSKCAEKLKKELRFFWNEFRIDGKLKEVKNLKPGNCKRQCGTPKEEIDFIKAKFLRQRRTLLREKLVQIEEENKKLQQEMRDENVIGLRRQIEEMRAMHF